ncbi:hypothetical protein [Streptomyces spongiicola]|uniref:hypothetical protein n=1 Tax=Streptomyces spongiicola TaxID=1690221 RepID=UPI0021D30F3E|nr:hypothetical protein [Streptomyces spongiicola]
MGHSSARAALIYQPATAERERLIGQAVSAVAEQARGQDPGRNGHATGTQGRIEGRGTHQGQVEEQSSDPALSRLERATGIEPA